MVSFTDQHKFVVALVAPIVELSLIASSQMDFNNFHGKSKSSVDSESSQRFDEMYSENKVTQSLFFGKEKQSGLFDNPFSMKKIFLCV